MSPMAQIRTNINAWPYACILWSSTKDNDRVGEVKLQYLIRQNDDHWTENTKVTQVSTQKQIHKRIHVEVWPYQHRQAPINNYNKGVDVWTPETNSTRCGDNFNLNKWSRARHLCPRLVLFMPDYFECTCAAVSPVGRVRCLVSCQCFPEPTRYTTYLPNVFSLSLLLPFRCSPALPLLLFTCHLFVVLCSFCSDLCDCD